MRATMTATLRSARSFIDDKDGVGLCLLVLGLLFAGWTLWHLFVLFWVVPGLFFTIAGLGFLCWLVF